MASAKGPGRFILTGSQNLFFMEKVSPTLAGRTAVLRLLPLTLSELAGRRPLNPRHLDSPPGAAKPPKLDRWTTIWTGFYPRIHDRDCSPIGGWLITSTRTSSGISGMSCESSISTRSSGSCAWRRQGQAGS